MTAEDSELPGRERRGAGRIAALLLADQGVLSVGNFLVGLLLGRLLLPAEFGAYTLAFTSLNALNAIHVALVITPLTVFGASHEGAELREYCGGSFAMQALVSAFMSLVALSVAGILALTRRDLAPAFVGLAVLIGLDEAREVTRCMLLARLKAVATLVNDTVLTALKVGAIGTLLLAHRRGSIDEPTARLALLCTAGATFLAMVMGLAQTWSYMGAPLAGLGKAWRENWKFGRWSLAGAASVALVGQLAQWLLAGLQGPAALAALGACQTLVFASNPLVNAFSSYWGPVAARKFTRGGIPALRESTRQYSLATFVFMGAFTAGIALGGGPLLHIVYSGRYDGHAGLLTLVAIASLIAAINRPLINALNAMRRPELQFASQVAGLTLSTLLAWPMVRFFGAAGLPLQNMTAGGTLLLVRGTLLGRAERPVERPEGGMKRPQVPSP